MRKRNKVAPPKSANAVDSLATLLAEVDEGIELLRPHYPDAADGELRTRAVGLLPRRWADGQWPDLAAIAQEKASTKEGPLPK